MTTAEMPRATTYTVAEVAAIIGVSDKTIYRWVNDETDPLPSIRARGSIRIPRAAVSELLGEDLEATERTENRNPSRAVR